MSHLYIYCAGGLGKEVLDIVMKINTIENRWSTFNFIDDFHPSNTDIGGIGVLSFNQLIEMNTQNRDFSLVIAHGDPHARKSILEKLKVNNLDSFLTSIISTEARVSHNAYIGRGTIICPGAHISVDVRIDDNCVINCNSIIGHDVTIDQNSVISSQVNLGGNVQISKNAFVGMGALIRERVKVGSNSIVGMGSSVHKDVPENTLCVGNPARVIQKSTNVRLYNN
jgi:sugar O-acyltransferase (sialic acid O-acetyltransferase NeuD family)